MDDITAKLQLLQIQIAAGDYKKSRHAEHEMGNEAITDEDIVQAVANGQILEDYPTHQRGACCLLGGTVSSGRPVHIVCTTGRSPLIIITAYIPQPPWWITPTQRGSKQ